jgi:superoxide reductase
MERREFAKSAILGVVAASAVPVASRAESADPYKNVVFTEADLGHWSPQIEKLHIPETTVAGGKLTIKTPHPMSEAHYIVSHTVVLGDGTFLSRKTFAYTDQPISEHALAAGYAGKMTVTSTCNQHDWWAKSISV